VALASIAALALSGNVFSTHNTTTMPVSLLIEGGCSVTASPMVFPSPVAQEALNATGQINITCTNGTPFEIGIDAGAHSADVAARAMQDAGTLELIVYSIYQTGAHVVVWGNTQGVDTIASAGDGFAQQFAAYGHIPVPATVPSAGTYTDTVNVFVYF
jgi:spore coat protein U-like protein